MRIAVPTVVSLPAATIAVELVDAGGTPLPRQPCRLEPNAGPASTGESGGAPIPNVPFGACWVSFPQVDLGDEAPLPRTLEPRPLPDAVAVRRRRDDAGSIQVVDGGRYVFQVGRLPARVVEVPTEGAVLLPEALAALGLCLRRSSARPDECLVVTGHGARSEARARSALFVLEGAERREAWAALSAETARDEDLERVRAWAGPAGPAGTRTDAALWRSVFDLYQRALATDRRGELRLWTDEEPAPEEPPHGGRPAHFPFLRIQRNNSLWPAKLARQATGDDADYLRSLDPINPHLCRNGQWKSWLVPGDEINLPERYAAALADPRFAGEHYDIHRRARPIRGLSNCRDHHPEGPRGARTVEVVFFADQDAPRRICLGEAPCTAATCELYDPRVYALDYRGTGDLAVTVVDRMTRRPLAGARVEADGRSGATDGTGGFVFRDLPAGTHEVTASKPGFAPVTRSATVVADDAASGDAGGAPPGSTLLPLASRARAAKLLWFTASFPANGRTEVLSAKAGSWTKLGGPGMAGYLAERKVFPPRSRLRLEWQIDHPDDVLVMLRHRPARDGRGMTNPRDRLLLPEGVDPRDHLTKVTRDGGGKGQVEWLHTPFPNGTFPDGSFFVDLELYDPADPAQPIATYVLGGYADFPSPRLERFFVDQRGTTVTLPGGRYRFEIPCDFRVSDTAYGHALWAVVIDEDSHKVVHRQRLKPHLAGPLAGSASLVLQTDTPFPGKVRLSVSAALLFLASEVPPGRETPPELRFVDPEGRPEGAVAARSTAFPILESGWEQTPETKAPAAGDEVLMVWVDRASGLDAFGAVVILLSGALLRATVTTSLAPGDYELAVDKARRGWKAGPTTDFNLRIDGLDPFTFPFFHDRCRLHVTNGSAYPIPGTSPVQLSASCEDFSGPFYRHDHRLAPMERLSSFVRVDYDDGLETADVDLDVIRDVGDEEMSDADARESWRQARIGPANRLFPRRMNKTTTPRLWALRSMVKKIQGDDLLLQVVSLGAKTVEFVISIDPFPGGMTFGRSYRASYTTSSRTAILREVIDEARWTAAASLRERAAAWKWAWRNPRGTVAVARATRRSNGEVKDFVAISGNGKNPFKEHWAKHKRPNEEFLQGAGHAEETILEQLPASEWQIESIGVTTNICAGTCSPLLQRRGLTPGGPRSPYRADYTDFKLAIKATGR